MIPQIVYALCAVTSIFCAVLLLRKYFQRKTQLLFWSGLCFVCLGLSNSLLFVDLVLVPQIDLSAYRLAISLVGVAMLLFGFIWETL